MNMASVFGPSGDLPTASGTSVHFRAATYLSANHGREAIAEAVRHGMVAKRRGDDDAASFWCSVCSALVQMRQIAPTYAA
jgi:hypothetical protein